MAAAAATTPARPAAPGVFSFVKHSAAISVRRCGLFLRALALHVALSTALSLFDILVVGPRFAGVKSSQGYDGSATSQDGDDAAAAEAIIDSGRQQLLMVAALAGYLVLYLAVWLAKRVATASAAVAAYSGERHTLGSFLRRVRGDLPGGCVAILLGLVLRMACAAAYTVVTAAAALLPALVYCKYKYSPAPLLLLETLFAALALPFHFYLKVVCAMAVVASVAAEPGRSGGRGAVARAWRAMAGVRGRALLYFVVTRALGEAVRSVGDLAVSGLTHGMDESEVSMVDAGITYVLHFVVEVFFVAAVTAYYFECRKRNDDKVGHKD